MELATERRPHRRLRLAAVCLFTSLPVLDLVAGCSPVLEATRPNPVNLTLFRPGQSHDSVIEEVGTPKGTMKEADGSSCDSYELYTHGPSGAGKAGLAFVEGAADVVTLGLAEVIFTPAEAATRNTLHPVTFCYRDDKLAKLTENGNVITSSESWGPSVANNDTASAPTPAASAAPAAAPTLTATH